MTVRSRILVFGENINDSKSIRELLLAANPTLDERRVMALPRPMSLTRQAKEPAVRKWLADLGSVIKGFEATGPVGGVVVHRDADGPDPAAVVERDLRSQLRPLGAHPVVPVQTIEAWWFLFPDAVEAVRPTVWRGVMPRQPRDVERIEKPKEKLHDLTRGRRHPSYAEADSPVIARHVRRLVLEPMGTAASYERLRDVGVAVG